MRWVAIRRPTQHTSTLADPRCLASETHVCNIAIQARRSEIASWAFAKRPGARVLQNLGSGFCSSECHICVRGMMRETRVSNARRLIVRSSGFSLASVLFTCSVCLVQDGAQVLRSKRPTHNTPTLADPGNLASATHMCVLSIKARCSEIAPPIHCKTPRRTRVAESSYRGLQF